ncbi:hypothetical protein [Thiomonas sp.]
MAHQIGKQVGIGDRLAAVAYQESSLGLFPNSPGHYGAGSVGQRALQVVLKAHPWLQAYFQGRNWARELKRSPSVSLWVSAYYLIHCYHRAHEHWTGAYSLYRYGSIQPGAPYPERIRQKLRLVRQVLKI